MNRSVKASIGVILVLIITFCAISVCQNMGNSVKVDVTEQNLYTLSEGTKSILAKLNQPIKVTLYYAATAALKGPDQIRFFNNYYQFVHSLLEEYSDASNGMIDLQVIDPRPFSEDEAQALRYGLQRFQITEEESFFFGLAIQTQFGIEKVIPFFSPDRQKFVEYDISYLIDTSIERQKTKIGIMSSLPVIGDDVSGYMAQMMRMQGQTPKPSWTFVDQLRKQYEVVKVEPDVEEIKEIDILLVIHPKGFAEKTLFAIDQFVLKNGRTILFVDPFCFSDQPDQKAMQMGQMPVRSSELNRLLTTWGITMPENNFAGDRDLALKASLSPDQMPEKVIGFLNLVPGCFNKNNVVTTDLNQVRVLMAGVLEEVESGHHSDGDKKTDTDIYNIVKTPLLTTTYRGNNWKVDSPYELMAINPSALMKKFVDGSKPVNMAYLLTGKFKSSFPDGVEFTVEDENSKNVHDPHSPAKPDESNSSISTTKKLTGITESEGERAVIVFSDVDFISDMVAYQDSLFGKMVVGDNGTLLLNAIDDLSGSSDLVSIRSRGNFKRPFIVVDAIEQQAERESSVEESKINAEIGKFQEELSSILTTAASKNEGQIVIGSEIVQKKKDLELRIHEQQRELRTVKMKKRQRIESLGNTLKNFTMLMTPAIILIVAIVLGVRRSIKKRYYIHHPDNE